MGSGKVKYIILGFCLPFLAVWAEPAFAVQQHGGSEGLISHQIGQILFISGMIYLLYLIYHYRITGPGWFEFKAFPWLVIMWNILTFTAHWMRKIADPEKFLTVNAIIPGHYHDPCR